MNFKTRKLVSPPDLNPKGTLFGGQLLKWIDEEAAIYAMCQLDSKNVVTKYMSEINFVNPAHNGDIIEIGAKVTAFGRTSMTMSCEVRLKGTQKTIIKIDKIVFVHLGDDGKPAPHGKGFVEIK